jgi:urease accessory protein UreE
MNQTEAAAAVGIKRPQLSRWEGKGDLPKPAGGVYTDADVERIKAYRIEARLNASRTKGEAEEAAGITEDSDAGIRQLRLNPEKAARVRYLIEKTASVKLDRELKAGGYLKHEDVEAANVRKVYAVRAKLQELPMRADLLAGKTVVEIEGLLTAWMKEVCEHFANDDRKAA